MTGEKSLMSSKEVLVVIIAYIMVLATKATGVEFPLTAEQILGLGLALVAIIRTLWTQGKITSIF